MAKTLIVLLLLFSQAAFTQSLRDPTQPPGSYNLLAGAMNDEMQALQLGAVDMLAPSLSQFGRIGFPEFELFDLPYLFPDVTSVRRITQGALGQRMLARLTRQRLVGLGFMDNGFKHMSANRPLLEPAHFAGLRMRIQASRVIAAQMRALGARPVTLAFSETRRALAAGVVDGTENPVSNFWTQSMHEAQSDLSLTGHAYLGYAIVANQGFWEGMAVADRELIAQALQESASYGNQIADAQYDKALSALRAVGTTRIHQPSAAQLALSSLRKCVSAGEALPASTRALWKQATGIELIDGIGSTELFHIFISADEAHSRPGATGLVVPGYEGRVIDENGHECPRGQVGRLAVRGPTGCRYLADERQRKYVQHGWNLTGDAYLQDADGYFVYQARTDDMIVSGGYNIAGPEVESALLLHPAVGECGVVGAADEERGQIVKAFVVMRPGYAAGDALVQELQDWCKRTIAPYKYPRQITFRQTLPRTETGKLQRFVLRQDSAPPTPAV